MRSASHFPPGIRRGRLKGSSSRQFTASGVLFGRDFGGRVGLDQFAVVDEFSAFAIGGTFGGDEDGGNDRRTTRGRGQHGDRRIRKGALPPCVTIGRNSAMPVSRLRKYIRQLPKSSLVYWISCNEYLAAEDERVAIADVALHRVSLDGGRRGQRVVGSRVGLGAPELKSIRFRGPAGRYRNSGDSGSRSR